MKPWISVFLLVASAVLAQTAKINGIVIDEHGDPAKNMTVEVYPLDMVVSTGMPRAISDEHGRFTLTVASGRTPEGRPFGLKWLVYPHQENGYYPDLSSRFYNTANSQAQKIEIPLEGRQEVNVLLELGLRAGALLGNVTDAKTSAPVKPQFAFAWASDPQNQLGGSTSSSYRFLIPSNTDILVTVLANGYKPWSHPGAVKVGPGQEMRFDIRLEPLSSKEP